MSRSSIDPAHTFAQRFHRAELELFDCPLGSIQPRRDIGNAPAFDKPHFEHAALVIRQFPNEPEHTRPLLFFLWILSTGKVSGAAHLTAGLRGSVGDLIGRDSKEPGRDRYASPLEA